MSVDVADLVYRYRWEVAALMTVGGIATVMKRRPTPRRAVAPLATYTPIPNGGWVDPDAVRRILAIAAPIERLANWTNFGVYLCAVAQRESGGNPNACNGPCDPNSAHGWFQIRPISLGVGELGFTPDDLFNERIAVAMAAWYAWRLRKHGAPGQVITWLDLRRGWASYKNVATPGVPAHTKAWFAKSLQHISVPESFMYERAFPPGFQWPGVNAVIAAAKGAHVP